MQMIREFIRKNRFPLGVAAVWLAVVWAFVLVADAYFGRPLSLTAWAGDWDGGWYQSVVNHGYYEGIPTQQENVAFFPLYPLLTWLVSKLAQLPVVWAGMLVSSVSFAAALVILHRFVGERWNAAAARWTVLLLAFNPFSFYFGMMYTESLFLALAAATLWYAYKKEWWWAALMAGLASGTRSVGMALGVMVVVGVVLDKLPALRQIKTGWQASGIFSSELARGGKFTMPDRTPSKPSALTLLQLPLLAALSFSGLILFSSYLWLHTGDPLVYKHAQEFWPGRGGLTNIIEELSYLAAAKTINLEYALTLMWYVATLVAFAGVALLIKMREYLLVLYSTIALSLPLLFGTATSMNRYALVAAPIFIAYAVLVTKCPNWVKFALATVCVAGLIAAIFLIVDPRAIFVG